MTAVSELKNVIQGDQYVAARQEDLDPAHHVLRMLITDHQLVYHVAAMASRRIVYFNSYHFRQATDTEAQGAAVTALIEKDPVLQQLKNADARIGIYCLPYFLVPDRYFDISTGSQLLLKSKTSSAGSEFRHDTVQDAFQVIYELPSSREKLIQHAFPASRCYNEVSPLLGEMLHSGKQSKEETLYVYVQESCIHTIVIRADALLFCNTFRYKAAEDVLYYVLNCCHHLALAPEKIKLILLGEIIKESTLYQLFYKYFTNLEFGSRPPSWVFTSDYPFPPHFYFNLFCV